ncbi:hypothetical protein L1887_35304 [Cichorium endivia]|nr:hypothetical protein L1887_35304 [Cichorium endivia]
MRFNYPKVVVKKSPTLGKHKNDHKNSISRRSNPSFVSPVSPKSVSHPLVAYPVEDVSRIEDLVSLNHVLTINDPKILDVTLNPAFGLAVQPNSCLGKSDFTRSSGPKSRSTFCALDSCLTTLIRNKDEQEVVSREIEKTEEISATLGTSYSDGFT